MRVYCKCMYCGKQITVDIPKKYLELNPDYKYGNSCNDCVSPDSPTRNGCEESVWTEY